MLLSLSSRKGTIQDTAFAPKHPPSGLGLRLSTPAVVGPSLLPISGERPAALPGGHPCRAVPGLVNGLPPLAHTSSEARAVPPWVSRRCQAAMRSWEGLGVSRLTTTNA